jgi:hypothetical protein
MRTTVRIDDDLMRLLKERARQENISLAKILNAALRRALTAERPPLRKRFRQKTHNMGKPLVDLTKALALAAALEDEEILRKMALGK